MVYITTNRFNIRAYVVDLFFELMLEVFNRVEIRRIG